MADSLVAHYCLNDNAASTAVDDTQDNAEGTATVNTDTIDTTGLINGAFQFNGTTAWVDCGTPAAINTLGNWTLCSWYKRNGHAAASQVLVGRYASNTTDNEFMIGVNTSGFAYTIRIVSQVPNNYDFFADNTNLDDNAWHHVLARFIQGTGTQLWVDGAYQGVDASFKDTVFTSITAKLFIGASDNAQRLPSSAAQDDVRLYNYDITDDNIAFLYNGGAGTESNTFTSASAPLTNRNSIRMGLGI